MKKVKIYFGKLSIPEKIQKARNLVARMDANSLFPSPQPALAEISTGAAALEQAYEEALNRGRIEVAAMKQLESILKNLIVSLAGYVQSISRGDEAVILSSGFDVQADKSRPGEIATPSNINGAIGRREGEVFLNWDRVPGAKAYHVQMSRDGLNDWTPCGSATRSRMRLSGLDSAARYFFRVAAIGPLGQSGWSDPGVGRTL